MLDVSITAENASEHSPNPERQTSSVGSKSTSRRADSSVTCGHTSSISFSQTLSSEPTPSKVRRKTVLQLGVNNVVSSVQSNSCFLSLEKTTINLFLAWGKRNKLNWPICGVFPTLQKLHWISWKVPSVRGKSWSLLTKFEDVMQSQNDDLEEQIASLKLLVSANLY